MAEILDLLSILHTVAARSRPRVPEVNQEDHQPHPLIMDYSVIILNELVL